MLTRILEPDEAAVATAIEDEIILLNFNAAETRFFGLRGAGVQIWGLIEQRSFTGEQIISQLIETHRGDADAIRRNVLETIEQLTRCELICQR